MTFAASTNIATMIFCIAVLVQSVRMMRALKTVQDGALAGVVEALDASTAQARSVLGDLKLTLGQCGGQARSLAEGKELADELSVMVGIADATAERLATAASDANRSAADVSRPDADLAIAA